MTNQERFSLVLERLPVEERERLMNLYPEAIELSLSGKERSELTEARIREVMGMIRPDTSEYDFLFLSKRIELKQAEAYLAQPKFQQIKPGCYPYIICMLNHKDKSEWYLLETSNISSKAGKENVEAGKLPLNAQHRYNLSEGQINPNKAFMEKAIHLGNFDPLMYHKSDLNLSEYTIREIFSKIENIITNH